MAVRRSLFILLIIMIVLPLAVFARQNTPATGDDTQALSNLQLYEVERDTVALSVDAIGSINANESIALSFSTGGRVAEVLVSRDDYVLAGDPLVRLENDNQRIAYEQALLNVESAELELQDLQTVSDSDIRIAEAAVDSAWGAYLSVENSILPEEIQAAELAYEQAQEAVEGARINRDRIGGQFGGDSEEWRLADAQLGETTFQAEIARLQAEQLRTANAPQLNAAYAGVVQAQRELDRLRAGPTEFEIESAETAIQRAETQLEQAEADYNETIVTAPVDGVITTLNAEVGGLVVPNVDVVEVANLSPLGLTVQVDEIDIGLVGVGQDVRVTLDALPETTFPATVTNIAPLGTPSGGIVTYDVDVELDVTDPRVRVGMTAEATIVIEEAPDVIAIPNLYIRRVRGSGQTFVNVLREDNSLEEVEVSLGIQGRETSEVTSGLEVGDRIAISLGGSLDILGTE